MERARSAVTNFFGRVPLTYTRFSLTQQMDTDNSQVEMKLAADEEDCGDHTLGDHVKHRNGNNCKSLCFKILGISLVFLIGFLIGYLSYRGRVASTPAVNGQNGQCLPVVVNTSSLTKESPSEQEEERIPEPQEPSLLHWNDLRDRLSFKIGNVFFEETIRKFYEESHEAGSLNDESRGLYIHEEFSKMSLDKVWEDEHYVTLQDAGSSPNKVTVLKSGNAIETFTPTAYVAYSPAASVTGNLVFCNYGRKEDFKTLQEIKMDLDGSIILVRSGLISFSEKVANAELFKAIGVLIYPDLSDYTYPGVERTIESPFGHAHYGTGDPYTPGFPSFNHTQFPPSKSSGLPKIPVQTLSSDDGKKLLELEGDACPSAWPRCRLGPQLKDANGIKLEVNNAMAEKKIHNVFGVIRGFDEPDRYVVVGAQRDAWGPGVAKSTVGTSILMELARLLSDLVRTDGYKPRRSIVFASWGAGEFGAVGATEWLEGYLTTLHLKAFSYVNLDSAVQGAGSFSVSASPLMYNVIEKTMKEVKDPAKTDYTIYAKLGTQASNWIQNIVVPLTMENAAYPFLAYSGIPSVSFCFQKDNKPYAYLGTKMDTLQNLKQLLNADFDRVCRTAAEFAAQIILRLTHDSTLPLDYSRYSKELLDSVMALNKYARDIKGMGLSLSWVNSARGDFYRAASSLEGELSQSDLDNRPVRRAFNDRVMKVEHSMLSPYVSPKETPFRHVLYGSGGHTFTALMDHLELLKINETLFDKDLFRNQLALLTWTFQGAANAMAGEIWEIDNEF
ncbi:hypothetical protein FKM82_017761 [Ascaphus truei]